MYEKYYELYFFMCEKILYEQYIFSSVKNKCLLVWKKNSGVKVSIKKQLTTIHYD
jgi:hypothetical protein